MTMKKIEKQIEDAIVSHRKSQLTVEDYDYIFSDILGVHSITNSNNLGKILLAHESDGKLIYSAIINKKIYYVVFSYTTGFYEEDSFQCCYMSNVCYDIFDEDDENFKNIYLELLMAEKYHNASTR